MSSVGPLSALVAGYAVATSSLLVGAVAALGAATVGIFMWPSLALVGLALPYTLPRTLSLGGLRDRDLAAIFFGIAILAWIRTSVPSRRVMLLIALEVGLATFVLISAVGLFDHPGVIASLAEVGAGLVALIAGLAIGTQTGLTPTLRVVRMLVLFVAVVALIAWVLEHGTPFSAGAFQETSRAELGDALGANGLGSFLAIGAVMEISLRRGSIWTTRSLLLLGILIGMVYLSGSRGAILVLGLGLLPIIIHMKRRLLSIVIASALVVAAGWAVVSLTLARGTSVARVGGDPSVLESGAALRADAAVLAVRLMIQHPITGVGYGQVSGFAATDPSLGVELDTHNEYLRVGAESGIPASILLLSILGVCIVTGARSAKRSGSVAVFGATAAVGAYAFSLLTVQGFSSFNLSAPWMLLAGCVVGAVESGSSLGRPRLNLATRSTTPHPAST